MQTICTVCPKGCHLTVDEGEGHAVTGNACARGEEYGRNELLHPMRTITSTVCIAGAALPRCPVKTSRPIPKGDIFAAVKLLDDVRLQAPVACGDVVVRDILGTGADFVLTRGMAAAGAP